MRNFYTVLLFFLFPWMLMRLFWRSFKAPEYRRRIGERLAWALPLELTGSLWLHAVSVGEVQAATPLVRLFREKYPVMPIVITTTTPTGSQHVRKLFGEGVFHVYAPFDIPFMVERFLDRTRPRLLVLVETEIWPNMLASCNRRGIPTLLANARLSERSARGYARLGSFTRQTFRAIDLIAAQSQADAKRFIELGAEPERVEVTGSIKFDMRLPASLNEQAEVVRRLWGNRPVWVAASTHEGEDEQLLDAHEFIREQLPGCLLVLVPRHPERFDRVAAQCERRGFSVVRRSEQRACTPETSVFLGDTMGELPIFLAAADVTFVGGSLVPHGGHNVLEPAALGVAVVFGPHMFNFAAISQLLLEKQAAVQVQDADALAKVVIRWLSDASERSRIGENGRCVVEENRGALERLAALIAAQLESRN
jgi:3-deoxy-D-manno-octulosonic-acid transferase